MDNVVIVLLVISLISSIAGLIVMSVMLKKKGSSYQVNGFQEMLDETSDLVSKNIDQSKKEMLTAVNTSSQSIGSIISPFMQNFDIKLDNLKNNVDQKLKEQRDELAESLKENNKEISETLKEIRESNEKQMKNIQDSNDKRLNEIKGVVDDSLTKTLDERITQAFEMVNQSLANVQRGFGEMNKLTESVGNLNRAFTNVKTRGTWGEVSLESILEQILTPDQYKKQYKIKHTKEMVDFAIKMPGQSGEELYLPMDAKFPIEDYERLVDASEKGLVELVNAAKKDLINRIKKEAKSIRDKYINPPYTTNFAVMYLPTEGLYAEVAKEPGLLDTLRRDCLITPCGPTTIAALLNSLQVGFTSLTIQKKSQEIQKAFISFRKDFKKFTDVVSQIDKGADTIKKNILNLKERNELILKRLDKFGDEEPDMVESQVDILEIEEKEV